MSIPVPLGEVAMSAIAPIRLFAFTAALAAPVQAACPPEAWLCASPQMSLREAIHPSLSKDEGVLMLGSKFGFERVEGEKFDFRPTFRLSEDSKLSVKLNKKKAELRFRMTLD
ncbi:hypothetical protein [Gulbenkiania mobilis]